MSGEQATGHREQPEPGEVGMDGAQEPAGEMDAGSQPEEDGGSAGSDLDGVRELVLRAYPDIVPELLAGESVDALLASVPAAREAYARVAAAIDEHIPEPIPTGSGRRPAIDVEGLSPELKIRTGLRQLSL